jgi:hypothetical protein
MNAEKFRYQQALSALVVLMASGESQFGCLFICTRCRLDANDGWGDAQCCTESFAGMGHFACGYVK